MCYVRANVGVLFLLGKKLKSSIFEITQFSMIRENLQSALTISRNLLLKLRTWRFAASLLFLPVISSVLGLAASSSNRVLPLSSITGVGPCLVPWKTGQNWGPPGRLLLPCSVLIRPTGQGSVTPHCAGASIHLLGTPDT